MRRTSPLLVILLLVPLLAAAPASAPAGQGAGGAFFYKVTFHGELAIAQWTTCPTWEVGLQCEETVAIVSDARTSELWSGGRLRDREDRVILQRFWYEVVELVDPETGDVELSTRPFRESFGGTNLATVSIDTRARAAVAEAAAIPMNTTDYVADTTYTETVAFQGSWQGLGPIVDLHERPAPSAPTWIHFDMTRGWQRSATAVGTIDGQPITAPLAPDGAVIFHARQMSLSVHPPRP
jgi:hypothetical protein